MFTKTFKLKRLKFKQPPFITYNSGNKNKIPDYAPTSLSGMT
ncbi:hypothetical protein VCHA42P256_110014 [Vibrio chagasii]|nr:hypothetical protein VCHA42P256_110014 [Vibrio chagasii]CAH6961539.1 hypothetical protein VCHA49P381_110040 [Vibrio chagasii]